MSKNEESNKVNTNVNAKNTNLIPPPPNKNETKSPLKKLQSPVPLAPKLQEQQQKKIQPTTNNINNNTNTFQPPPTSFNFTNLNGVAQTLPAGYSFPQLAGTGIPFIPVKPPQVTNSQNYEQFVPVSSNGAPKYVVGDLNAAPNDREGQHMFKYFDAYGYQKSREFDESKKRKKAYQPKVTKKQIKMFKRRKKQRQKRSFIERLNS